MTEIVVTRLTPVFAARVDGVDITRELDAAAWERVRAAFEEHRATPFDSVRHKRLMQRTTISGDPAEPTPAAGA